MLPKRSNLRAIYPDSASLSSLWFKLLWMGQLSEQLRSSSIVVAHTVSLTFPNDVQNGNS